MPSIAYITAGAGGMICGSCLRDNTLAAELHRRGVDFQLIPTYTPIRTDEHDESIHRVFFGGISVYLEQQLPGFRYLPTWLTGWLDQPALIRWAASRGIETDPQWLGGMTVSMLRGTLGNQRREVRKLASYLERDVRPGLVNFTNMLIAGCVPEIKRRLDVPVVVTLQGDDVFLDGLIEPYRTQAMRRIREIGAEIDGFVTFNRFYADYMSEYLAIPREKVFQVPLGIGIDDFGVEAPDEGTEPMTAAAGRRRTIGYLARLAPEKGLHLLVDAFIRLKEMPGMDDVRLVVAGWVGGAGEAYAADQFEKLRAAGLADAFVYLGTIDRRQKIEMLRSLDVFSVPTQFKEPKGLYVLEALAAGVPVVQPNHGAFPELIEATGGGRLFEPGSAGELCRVLADLLSDAAERTRLGTHGQQAVRQVFTAKAMADGTRAIYGRLMSNFAAGT